MRVVVVGGGLSGLFTAAELIAAGVDDLVVVDRSPLPGGVARTIERDGFLLEPAAGSFSLPHPHLGPILDRIGAEAIEAGRAVSTRSVYVGGRLVEVPASPRALLAPVLSWKSKARALAEPLVGRAPGSDEETLAGFCRRRFGRTAGEMLSWLMASGVYGGDPHRLSAPSAFPMLTALEGQHGSVLRGPLRARHDRRARGLAPKVHVPVGGMAGLADAAVGFLGGRFRGGFEVQSVRPRGEGWVVEGDEALHADAVIVAAHPWQAARLVDDALRAHLSRVRSAPVAVIGLGGRGESAVPASFGALIGPAEPLVSLGILFESSYAPDRSPQGSWLLKVIAGGATHPEVVDWDDRRLVGRAIEEAALVLGSDLAPSFTELVRHRPGIPQPEIGHAGWLTGLDALLLDRPGLQLTGWGYRGVGVAHLAADAARVAAVLAT